MDLRVGLNRGIWRRLIVTGRNRRDRRWSPLVLSQDVVRVTLREEGGDVTVVVLRSRVSTRDARGLWGEEGWDQIKVVKIK